jgi:error-prone DNA polymerase
MIELHARSCFSFLAGASTPEDLVDTAARLEMPALALTDIDNLAGAPRFYMAAKKAGLKAHVGAEITLTRGGRLTLLAEDRIGYQNLSRLITSMKLRAPKGEHAASEDELRQYAPGLVCLARGEHPLDWLESIYGRSHLALELNRHGVREQEARNQWLLEQSASRKLPCIASNAPVYATRAARQLFDVMTCVRHKTTLAEAGRLLELNSERELKSARAMTRLFAACPHALDAARDLSARLDFTLRDLGYRFPPYPVPDGETMNSFLRKRTEEGARLRFRPYTEKHQRQIERELALIEKLDLAGYFLIVWDIVRFCRENGILAQGRGSAANSAVCYSLFITAVDPIALDLLFERFLSENRGEWPDIDIDLPSGDQRERVIQYVYQRYGARGAAMTANVITYRGRSAIRDIGKVMGFANDDLGKLASCVSRWGFRDEGDTPERQFAAAELPLEDPKIRKFLELYERMRSLPRHLGQHSGGMVICQGALDQVVPLEPATMPGRVIIQWDKEDCADLGLIKVDLLGLGMMAVIEETTAFIHNFHRRELDIGQLPADDPAVYQDLQTADTVGLFQVESRAQMASLPLVKPEKFYDIVVQVAIIRPGPIVGKLYHPYVRRRQGLEPPVSLHPSLEPVLKRTLGVPLFQEQLLRVAMISANFTGSQAEELRRALGFQRSPQRMNAIEGRLRSGMAANGITGETQDRIVQAITSFALYGFPESHAASFALLAYASAWLRVHYRAAFTAALLNNQPMGFYHPSTIVKDAQRHGLRVLPADVHVSRWRSEPESRDGQVCLRLGLNYIRGLRQPAAEAIVERRPFTSIADLARRVPELRKDELRMLAQAGALNHVEDQTDRRKALWQSEWAIRRAGPLLDQLEPSTRDSPLKSMSPEERVYADFQSYGLSVGRHPVAFRREELTRLGVTRAGDLQQVPNGRPVRIAGAVITRQRPETAKGFAFFSLEDETGIANAIVRPDDFVNQRLVMVNEPYLLMEGILQNQSGAISVRVHHAEALRFGAAPIASHDFH